MTSQAKHYVIPAVTDAEEWRDVSGYEGIYQVSDHGRVKVLDRPILRPNGVIAIRKERLKSIQKNNGWEARMVSFTKNGETETVSLPALVLETFGFARPDNSVPRHKDGDQGNNCVSNLYWAEKEIMRGERSSQAKLSERKVIEIKRLLAENIPEQKIAQIFRVGRGCINAIHRGSNWSHVQIPVAPLYNG